MNFIHKLLDIGSAAYVMSKCVLSLFRLSEEDMRNIFRKNIGQYILFLGMMMFAIMLIPKQVVFAGDINSSEAGLIAAASGTFTYDGKTYRAGSAYVNSLTSYLSGDDVDLTAEQCQNVSRICPVAIA